jgi:hypothetical protein
MIMILEYQTVHKLNFKIVFTDLPTANSEYNMENEFV